MSSQPVQPQPIRLPRRFKWHHPRMLLLMPLAAIILLAEGILFCDLLWRSLGTTLPPGVNPMAAVVIGVIGGFSAVECKRWIIRRHFQRLVRALAFRERQCGLAVLSALVIPAFWAAAVAVLYLVAGAPGLFAFPLTSGSLLVPLVFLYHPYSRVYDCARQCLAKAAETVPPDPTLPVCSGPNRAQVWINRLGALSVAAVLAVGAWLQWGLPFLAQREPKEYVTKPQVRSLAVRLTYGADAGPPAVSPNGRFVAYVQTAGAFRGRIQIMRPDGSGKRFLEAKRLLPSLFRPLTWSPDGKRVLVVGEAIRPRRGTAWLPEMTGAYDLWTVDVKTGAERRLTKGGSFTQAIWLGHPHGIAALDHGGREGQRLWITDEHGRSLKQVMGLKVRSGLSAIFPWHERREVVVAGQDESTGIWSVDAASGRATKLSTIAARWALPLDEDRLIFAVRGRPDPPLREATSIGIVVPSTGQVRWVLRGLQGLAASPAYVREPSVVVFTLRLDENTDLWALRLRDGKLGRLTRGEDIWQYAVNPRAQEVLYSARGGEPKPKGLALFDQAIWRLRPVRWISPW